MLLLTFRLAFHEHIIRQIKDDVHQPVPRLNEENKPFNDNRFDEGKGHHILSMRKQTPEKAVAGVSILHAVLYLTFICLY
jgi:hypothetical protein